MTLRTAVRVKEPASATRLFAPLMLRPGHVVVDVVEQRPFYYCSWCRTALLEVQVSYHRCTDLN